MKSLRTTLSIVMALKLAFSDRGNMTLFEDIIYIFRTFIIIVAGMLVITYAAAYLDGYFHAKAVHAKE